MHKAESIHIMRVIQAHDGKVTTTNENSSSGYSRIITIIKAIGITNSKTTSNNNNSRKGRAEGRSRYNHNPCKLVRRKRTKILEKEQS